MSDKLWVYGAKVQFFSDIYKKCIYIIFLKCFFLRFPSFVPSLFPSGKRPRRNQRRTKERPKNSKTQKSTFIKIAHSFTSLIPSFILPTDNRETTDRTPNQLPAHKKCFFLRLLSKKVVPLPKKVDSYPKTIDYFPKNFYSIPKKIYSLLRISCSSFIAFYIQ